MKKLMLLIGIILLFSCEKDVIEPKKELPPSLSGTWDMIYTCPLNNPSKTTLSLQQNGSRLQGWANVSSPIMFYLVQLKPSKIYGDTVFIDFSSNGWSRSVFKGIVNDDFDYMNGEFSYKMQFDWRLDSVVINGVIYFLEMERPWMNYATIISPWSARKRYNN